MYITCVCGLTSLTDSYIDTVERSGRKLHNEEFHNKFCYDKQIKEAGNFIGAFVKNTTEEKNIQSSDRKTNESENFENLSVIERIIMVHLTDKRWEGLECVYLDQGRNY
jgi:hypothetical protein